MPWRISTQVPGYYRYATLCPQCGRERGWPERNAADRHLLDLADAGLVQGRSRVAEFPLGWDGTCDCEPPPPPPTPLPTRRRRRS